MKNFILLLITLIGISYHSLGQLPTTCANMDPICTNVGLNFTAEASGVSAPAGNNYGCLGSQPNPTWYYIQVANSGPINMTLSAGSDVDYILYGPYSSLSNAQSYCGNMGTAATGSSVNMTLNCSYSPSATENPTIPNAVAGQVYVLLITNYANVVQTITLTQSNFGDAGAGSTDCSIVTPCVVNNLNATIGACNPATNTFNITGTVDISNPPTSGNLIAVDCNGNQTIVASAPFSASSYNFSINNIPSDGAACNLKVYFSADNTCTQTVNYTNPAPCNPSCMITNFEVYDTAQCNQIWKSDVVIEFTNPPTSGNLVVQDCQGNITVIDSYPFSSPATGTFSTTVGSATPFNCSYTAYFTADPSCTMTNTFSPLPATPPSDEAGTFTESMSGDGTHTYILCDGDSFTMNSNGDSSIPPIAPGNDPSVIYFVYKCPPSPGGPGIDPSVDPCLVGYIGSSGLTLINNGGSSDSFLTSLGALPNNTFYLVPMTLGSLSGLTYQANCYDLSIGDQQTVQYLNPITYTVTSDCQAGTVTVSNLQGGYPQFYGGNYTGSNLTPASASFSTGSAGLGGSIVVSGLQNGDNYSFDITDGNGCPKTITGTFVGVQDPSFSYPNNTYCTTDTDPSPTITGVNGGTFTVSPAGVTVNPSTGVIDLSSAPAGGTFTITYKTPDPTCFGTATFNVTINPQPTVSVSNTAICNGSSGTLNATVAPAGGTYSWSPSGGSSSSSMSASPTITTVYTLTYTSPAGCSNTATGTITVNPIPTVSVSNTSVCSGASGTLSSTVSPTGGTYAWSPSGGSSASMTASPASTTTYTLTYTSSAACSNSATGTITVNPLPTVVAGPDQAVCNGTSVTLSGSGAQSYTWDNGVTNGVAFTPAVGSITYTVTGTDANGCVNTDQAVVTVNPNPSFTLSGTNPTVCGGTDGSITLSGLSASTTYTVTYNDGATTVGPASMSSNGSGNIVINGLNQGTYSNFVVSSAAGCSTTVPGPVNLSDPSATTVSATGGTICVGGSTPISATGNPVGGSYTWSPATGLSGTTGASVTASPNNTSTYTVSYTLSGCTTTATATVTVNPLPNVNAGADQSICIGASTSLSGSGASSYTWNNGVTNGTPFSPGATNTYTVTGTDANGCVNTDQVVVTVNPLPTINAGADQTVCNGSSVTFTASGAGAGGTYSWTNGITNGVPFTPPLGTNTYTVTGTDANGCVNTDQAAVTVNPIPLVNAGPDQSVCIGSSVTLTASGASSYTWDNGVSNGVAFTPAVGSITYTVTGSSLSCSSTDQVVVTVNPLPNVNAGNDVIVCESGSVILTASGAQTYTWNNGVNDGVSFTAPLDTTQYSVTGTDANGCKNTDTLVVNVIPTPVVNFVGDKLKGCSPLTTTFTNNSTGNLTNCKWSFSNGQLLTGCGAVTATFNAVGCYDATLTVSTPEGCTNTMTIANYVCVVPDPIADFYTDPEELSTEQWTANMVNTSVNGSSYQWTFGDGSSISTEVSPSHDYPNAQSGNYEIQLIATSAEGCTDTTTRVITLKEDLIFYVPNSFTPDNDAFNQTFKPIFSTGYDPYHYTLYIFDRWGEILFESHNTEVGWDGTYGGKLVEDGVYIWKISVKRRDTDEKVERVGHVSVLK